MEKKQPLTPTSPTVFLSLSRTSSQVVPFSQRSGVLEWCSGTVPIGEFLVDPNKGAHKRFRPCDWTNLACRKKMMVQHSHTQLLRNLFQIKCSCLSLSFLSLVLYNCRSNQNFTLNLSCLQEAQRLAFDEKLQAYSEVCKSFRPVFRYFCMERFLDPAVWMEKRLAYTRSVATSSIGTDSTVCSLQVLYHKYNMSHTRRPLGPF